MLGAEADDVDVCSAHIKHDDDVNHVLKNMPESMVLENLSELFKVLGDVTRVRILWALSMQELCVCDLTAVMGMTQSAISHQLRLLKSAKLVRSRREGRSVYYSLADTHVSLLFSQGLEHVKEKE